MTDETDTKAFDNAVEAVRGGADAAEHARALYGQLTPPERLSLLDGDLPFYAGIKHMMTERYNVRPYVMGAIDRLGIPGIRFVDGPRGCVSGQGTAFPVAMARGATWDVHLEERVGRVIGEELRAAGGNFFGGICVNLVRHPAWGRAQESYGDEPYHLGEFGAALHRGVHPFAMTCVKHYAVNSMENARFKVDVTISDADLHDMYLPHFRRVVDAGASAVMSSYNSVNGEWAGQNAGLLTDVLRTQWGFEGLVISDFILGLRDAATSLNAGLDLEAPYAQQRATHMPRQLEEGATSWAMVERAGVRLLAAQLRSYAHRQDISDTATMASTPARALAREVAGRAMVLLKNEAVDGTPVLPITPGSVQSIAVIGRLAAEPNMGDHGSSRVDPPSHVTPIDGLRAAYPDADITLIADDSPEAAASAAAAADVAIIVAGYDWQDEGEFVGGSEMRTDPVLMALYPPPPPGMHEEMARIAAAGTSDRIMANVKGGDRKSLTLRPIDEAIITAVAAANPRTVVAVVTAGAIITEAWRERVPSILMMWYAGMEGGHALADVVSGAVNPSGRLPYALPKRAEDMPFFDRDARQIRYERLHGQRLLDSRGVDAAFPHGFGLSYTNFEMSDAKIVVGEDPAFAVSVMVENTGSRAGHHVIQVYGRRREEPYTLQAMVLGFAAVAIAAGETKQVSVSCSFLPLAAWDVTSRTRVVPTFAQVAINVGAYAHDPSALDAAVA